MLAAFLDVDVPRLSSFNKISLWLMRTDPGQLCNGVFLEFFERKQEEGKGNSGV